MQIMHRKVTILFDLPDYVDFNIPVVLPYFL